MQLENMTVDQLKELVQNSTDINEVKAIALGFADDLKTTKDTTVKICEAFELYENGEFIKPTPKKLVGSVGGLMSSLITSSGISKLAEKFSFLSSIMVIAKKYKSF